MNIAAKLTGVREQIATACARADRRADEVELVAVTKTHPAELVREAIAAGQMLFGENKVQEARAKIPALPSAVRWHLIGHLQKNKVRHALPLFEMIHSVDSLDIARAISRVAEEQGHRPRVLLEVNVSGEGSKFGFKPETLSEQWEQLLVLDRIGIEGLMTIPPFHEEAEASRKFFVRLRELRDELESAAGIRLPHLSMGMSGDFTIAIEEGATLVRVGTAIFGERTKWRERVAAIED
jgi:pyridoxal phosphate enzyme (YggS family)